MSSSNHSADHKKDNGADSYRLISQVKNSKYATSSLEKDGFGDKDAEAKDISYHQNNSSDELGSDNNNNDSDHSVMSAPGVLSSVSKNLQKSSTVSIQTLNNGHSSGSVDVENNYPHTAQSYLEEVLKDFNAIYERKLESIDCNQNCSDAHTQMITMERKNEILEKWAKDVCSQNMLLVHTIEELEEEANRKLRTQQIKINSATIAAEARKEVIHKCEQRIEKLQANQEAALKKYELLNYEHKDANRICKLTQQRLNAIENDNDGLKSLICRIRDMGVWDVSGLQLLPDTYDLLFGLYPNLPGSEVQTVFTREKARSIYDNEMKIKDLENYISELKHSKKELGSTSEERQRTIIALEAEVKSLSTLLKHYQRQCEDFRRNLEETQTKLIQETNKSNLTTSQNREELKSAMSKRDQDVREMLSELRNLKSQLNVACDEKQHAICKTNALKHELIDRTSEMLEMKNILQSIQTEAQCTRSVVENVQEKQDHLSKLKDEVQAYHVKYEQAQALLCTKSEVIQSLKQQMDLLHDKVNHLEHPGLRLNTKNCDTVDSVQATTSNRDLIPAIIDSSVSAALRKFELSAKQRVQQMLGETNESKSAKPTWTTHFTKAAKQSGNNVPSTSPQKSIIKHDKKVTTSHGASKKSDTTKLSKSALASPFQAADKKTKKPSRHTAVADVDTNKSRAKDTKRTTAAKSSSQPLERNKNLKLPNIGGTTECAKKCTKRNLISTRSSEGLGVSRLPRLVEKSGGNIGRTSTCVDAAKVKNKSNHLLRNKEVFKDGAYNMEVDPWLKNRRSRSTPKISGREKIYSTSTKRQMNRAPDTTRPSTAVSECFTMPTTPFSGKLQGGEVDELFPSVSWNAEEMLKKLPQHSNEESVKSWIASSSRTCVKMNEKFKKTSKSNLTIRSQSSNSSVRKSLRRRKRSGPRDNTSFNLEDEWNKTMAKVRKNKRYHEEKEEMTAQDPDYSSNKSNDSN